jgi:hypothetical protein
LYIPTKEIQEDDSHIIDTAAYTVSFLIHDKTLTDDCYVLVTYLVTATFQLFYVAEIIPRQAQVGVRRQNDRFVRSRSNHHQAAVPMATGEASKDKRKPSRHHPLSIHTYVPIYAPQIRYILPLPELEYTWMSNKPPNVQRYHHLTKEPVIQEQSPRQILETMQ